MPLSEINCSKCGSQEATEFKPGKYVCSACEAMFEYQDPNRSEMDDIRALAMESLITHSCRK